MNRRSAFALALLAGCAPDIPNSPKPNVVVAQFDPLAAPPVLPLPNDLALDRKTGLLNIPDNPGDSAAQKAFNVYLRTLDGFPSATPVTATFSAAIDPASAKVSTTASAGSIALVDVSSTEVLGPDKFTPRVSTDGKTLTLVPKSPLKLHHTYIAAIFGGDDPNAIKGADGTQVVAAPFTFFLRSARPLLSTCSDQSLAPESCVCPRDAKTGAYDSSCIPAQGLTFAQAAQIEPVRQQVSANFDLLANAVSPIGMVHERRNLVLFWNFTIASGPFAVFDPTTGRIPFPNDVLLDQTTKTVNLPIPASASDAQKAIYMGLNKLDGFSTTADVTVPIDTADGQAPKGVVAKQTALLINSNIGNPAEYDAKPERVNGGKDYDSLVKMTPIVPLQSDGALYVAVITRGITDTGGRPLKPSPVMQLLLSESPLFDDKTMKSLVSVLDDASAKQLEGLRSAFVSNNLFGQLDLFFGVKKADIAMVWVFHTQSEAKPLQSLAKLPMTRNLPTDITIFDEQTGTTTYGTHVGQVVSGSMKSHLALATDGTLDLAGGKDVDVPFTLIAPLANLQAAPVVILQHGIYGWRGDMLAPLAEPFTNAGFAVVGIDINFHGPRSVCTDDKQCAAGGTCNKATGACSTKLLVTCRQDADCAGGGTCTVASGQCSTSLAPNSSLCFSHKDGSGQTIADCKPAASGAAFLNFTNLFATRDNLRQHVVDLSQLDRVIRGPELKAKLAALTVGVKIDNTRDYYLGQSLGGIEGALFLAASPTPTVGVLNVPGGRLIDVFTTSPAFMNQVGPLLAANMITPDSPGYYQLLNTFRWILDPGDPINFGHYITRAPLPGNTAKKVIVQEAGADMVITNPWTDALAREIGLPFVGGHPAVNAQLVNSTVQDVSTYFPGAPHGFISDVKATGHANGVTQAITWIASDGTQITAP